VRSQQVEVGLQLRDPIELNVQGLMSALKLDPELFELPAQVVD
jgi:hypothetical protein